MAGPGGQMESAEICCAGEKSDSQLLGQGVGPMLIHIFMSIIQYLNYTLMLNFNYTHVIFTTFLAFLAILEL